MDVPWLVVIVAVVAVIAVIGIGAYLVMRGSSDRDDRGPYSSGAETTGSFAAFGTTVDDSGGDRGSDGSGDDGGGGPGSST